MDREEIIKLAVGEAAKHIDDQKALEVLVYHAFYNGGLGGATERVAAAIREAGFAR